MSRSELPNFQIVNIVSIWDIGPTKINVDNTNRKKRFNAQVIRTKDGIFLVFASGKVTATGFKHLDKVQSSLQKVLPYKQIKFIKTVNITANSFVKEKFIYKLLTDVYKDASYEPEIYPAIYLKLNKVTFIYYGTGSVIITGAKSIEQIEVAINQFQERVAVLEQMTKQISFSETSRNV